MLVTSVVTEVEPSGKTEVERMVVFTSDVINELLGLDDAELECSLEATDKISEEATVEEVTALSSPVFVVVSGAELLDAGLSSELVLVTGAGSSLEDAKKAEHFYVESEIIT